MADPKDLPEAADAIHEVRGLAAVQRHKELDDPLRQAEDWARKEYRKVSERNGDPDTSGIGNNPPRLGSGVFGPINVKKTVGHDGANYPPFPGDVLSLANSDSYRRNRSVVRGTTMPAPR